MRSVYATSRRETESRLAHSNPPRQLGLAHPLVPAAKSDRSGGRSPPPAATDLRPESPSPIPSGPEGSPRCPDPASRTPTTEASTADHPAPSGPPPPQPH